MLSSFVICFGSKIILFKFELYILKSTILSLYEIKKGVFVLFKNILLFILLLFELKILF